MDPKAIRRVSPSKVSMYTNSRPTTYSADNKVHDIFPKARRPSRRPSSGKFEQSKFIQAFGQLCGKDSHSFPESKVWERLLFHSPPTVNGSQDEDDLFLSTAVMAENMVENNASTSNFNVMILYFLSVMRKMRFKAYEGEWPVDTVNLILAIRITIKWLAQYKKPADIIQMMENDRHKMNGQTNGQVKVSSLVFGKRSSFCGEMLEIDTIVQIEKRQRHVVLFEELIQLIIYSNTNSILNYQVYLESLHLLMNLLSTQMFSPPSIKNFQNLDVFWKMLLNQFGHFANLIVVRLLRNYIEQHSVPDDTQGNGLFMSAFNFLVGKAVADSQSPIADNSINLLLLLSSQCSDASNSSFKDAIGVFETATDSALSVTIDGPRDDTHISFKQIFNQIAKSLDKDETVVLLYLMLVRNNHFRIYFLSRTDPEEMVLSILKATFEASSRPVYTLYLCLDILVMLSLDEACCLNIQKISIEPPKWYTDRSLRKVSLGGLLLLIVLKIMTNNASKTHDLHVHTATIAILSNLGPSIIEIETIVAQKLISVFELTSKKFQRVIEESDEDVLETPTDLMIAISDMVALFLEVLNSIITSSLKDNSLLTYILLQRKDLIAYFDDYTRFKPLTSNILTAISFFHEKIEAADVGQPTVDALLSLIDKANQTWSSATKIKHIPPTKFVLSESQESTSEHLNPFCWSFLVRLGIVQQPDDEWTFIEEELGEC